MRVPASYLLPRLLLYALGSGPLALHPLLRSGTDLLDIRLLQILTLDSVTPKMNSLTQNDNSVPSGFILNRWLDPLPD